MNDSSPAPHRAGAIVLAVYVAVALATMALSGRHVRPLFEGFPTQQIPYKWVKPPPSFATGNQVPQPSITDVPLDASGSKAIGVTTEDGQLVLNLPVGATTANGSDTALRVLLRPLDPATLAPVPSGLLANGNAYQVQLAYQPSGAPATIKVAGNIILTVPSPSTTMLFSPDGKAWQKLVTQQVGGPTVIGSEFTAGGYFLGTAVKHKVSTKGTASSVPTVVLAAITAALALAIFFVPLGIRRLRSRPAAPGPARTSRKARASGRRTPTKKKGKRRR
ncbi:MAG: hypothetical protein QOG03_396 [Actinomycetota bacterium]|jgi:hypothetical protein|nr:hypothetical protein [Actinomycetota bacterium]